MIDPLNPLSLVIACPSTSTNAGLDCESIQDVSQKGRYQMTLRELNHKYEQLRTLITVRTEEYKRLGEELEILHAQADRLEHQIAEWKEVR